MSLDIIRDAVDESLQSVGDYTNVDMNSTFGLLYFLSCIIWSCFFILAVSRVSLFG